MQNHHSILFLIYLNKLPQRSGKRFDLPSLRIRAWGNGLVFS